MRKGGPAKSKQFNAKAYERPGLTEEEVLEIKEAPLDLLCAFLDLAL